MRGAWMTNYSTDCARSLFFCFTVSLPRMHASHGHLHEKVRREYDVALYHVALSLFIIVFCRSLLLSH